MVLGAKLRATRSVGACQLAASILSAIDLAGTRLAIGPGGALGFTRLR
jgi:hypothetical protein